jgi:uncharacterized protein
MTSLKFLLLLLLCIPAAAQVTAPAGTENPATKELVQKLFEAMHIRQQSRLMMDSMQKQMQAATAETIKARYPQITPTELARASKISEEMFKEIPLDAMLDDMIPVYQKHLTGTDVAAMIVFYSSPTGQKLMQQMPEITQEAMQVSYRRMQKQIDGVMERIDDSLKKEESPNGTHGQSPPPKLP